MIVRSFYSSGFQETVDCILEKDGARVVLKQNLSFPDCIGLSAESMQMGYFGFNHPLFLLMICWHPARGVCSDDLEWVGARLLKRLQLTEHAVIGIGVLNGRTDRLYLVVDRVHPGCHDDRYNLLPDGRDIKPLWRMWNAGRRIRAELRFQAGQGGERVVGWKKKYRVLCPWNSKYRGRPSEHWWTYKGVMEYVPHKISF